MFRWSSETQLNKLSAAAITLTARRVPIYSSTLFSSAAQNFCFHTVCKTVHTAQVGKWELCTECEPHSHFQIYPLHFDFCCHKAESRAMDWNISHWSLFVVHVARLGSTPVFLWLAVFTLSWGCYSVADDDYGVLGYEAMLISNLLPTVRTTLKMEAADFRNICGKLPINTALCSRETVIVVSHYFLCLMLMATVAIERWTLRIRGLLEKYPTFGREKETGLLGALDT